MLPFSSALEVSVLFYFKDTKLRHKVPYFPSDVNNTEKVKFSELRKRKWRLNLRHFCTAYNPDIGQFNNWWSNTFFRKQSPPSSPFPRRRDQMPSNDFLPPLLKRLSQVTASARVQYQQSSTQQHRSDRKTKIITKQYHRYQRLIHENDPPLAAIPAFSSSWSRFWRVCDTKFQLSIKRSMHLKSNLTYLCHKLSKNNDFPRKIPQKNYMFRGR